jgi:phage baseplate assembly protein W
MAANPTAFRDAESAGQERSAQVFKDLNLNLVRHPLTGDIGKLTDAEAVKRSIRNLVNTNFYERPFHPEIGSDVRSILFEPVTPVVAATLKRYIEDVIFNFEPRAELAVVTAIPDLDGNRYIVTIEFYLVNSTSGIQTVDLFLERLR